MRAWSKAFDRARALRRRMTLPEVVLWQALRKRQLVRAHFRRQHPMGPYILDFYCAAARLAIEVDGRGHELLDRAHRDERRDAWLTRRGISVIRIPAADVLRDERLEAVLRTIEGTLIAPSGALRAPPPPQSGGGTEC